MAQTATATRHDSPLPPARSRGALAKAVIVSVLVHASIVAAILA